MNHTYQYTPRSPKRATPVCLLFACSVALLVGLVSFPMQSQASLAASQKQMATGKSLYASKKWEPALASFLKALRSLRGKPIFRKAPVYAYIGLCLYQQGHRGLAWKAFEQALFSNTNLSLPTEAKAGSDLQAFFARVKSRVKQRGGANLATNNTSSGPANAGGGNSNILANPLFWASITVALTGLTTGIIFAVDAGNNQQNVSTISENFKNELDSTQIAQLTQSHQGTVGSQNIGAGISFALAGIGVAGVVLSIILKPKAAPKTASLPLTGTNARRTLIQTAP